MLDHSPQLPIQEEGRLDDPAPCEHFIERAFRRSRSRGFMPRVGAVALLRFDLLKLVKLVKHELASLRDPLDFEP